jgi:anti-repressor protein
MQELVKVTISSEGSQLVNARELYDWLEIEDHFTQWANRMFEYGFEEGVDYQAINQYVKHQNGIGGTNKIDYALTLNCAKEISMIQRSDKGKEARQYFIECERKLIETKPSLPTTYLEALKELIIKEETNQKLIAETVEQKQIIEEQKPKVEFYNQVADTTTSFDMQEVAAMLKLNYGRNILFRKLREASVLMEDNLPYRSHINNGYFIVVETKWMNIKTDQANAAFQTRITQKGLDWLQKNQEKFRL